MQSEARIKGHKMSFMDRGTGDAVVIVHGTPTNSSEYHEVVDSLSKHFRCVALDHLGFGDSDKPKDGDYSIQAHVDRLVLLLDQLDIGTFHLVVHDFGGVIGLPLIRNPKFSVKSVTILNSWLWPLIETEPQMKGQEWLLKTGVFPFLYRNLNFSPRFLIKLGWGTRRPLSRKRHQAYIDQFPTKRDREGTVGFLNALFEFDNQCWRQPELLSELARMPVQILWGTADKLISVRNLQRWKVLLPNAEIHELKDVGHFVAEEASSEIVSLMERFLRKAP